MPRGLTVEQNLTLVLEARLPDAASRKARMTELIEEFRLGELRSVAWMILAGYVLETIWRLAPAFTPNPLIVIAVMLIGWIVWLILRRPLPEAGLV